MTMYWYSIVPDAGTSKAFGIAISTSGRMFQPCINVNGAGLSLVSPSGAPVSAQVTSALTSASVSARALRKWPYAGSASQGGIFLDSTADFIAFVQGRAS